jgi:hypothetical protein
MAQADSSCCAISVPQPKWLEEVVPCYESDGYAQSLISGLLLDSSSVQNFS